MPPAKVTEHDAIVLVLDTGKSVSQKFDEEKCSFFEHAKYCISWIIQRKLISRSTDQLSIVLMGTDDTKNDLHYRNITCPFDFQLTSWEMLSLIEKEVKTTDRDSDWIKALIVCMDMLKKHEDLYQVQCRSKKIVIFSDFTNPASNQMNTIISAIKKKQIEITIIGPDCTRLSDPDTDGPSAKRFRSQNGEMIEISQDRIRGERLVLEMSEQLGELMQICTFEQALKQLSAYTKKNVRPTPWNCVLDIGDVEINISAFKKTDTKSGNKFDTKYLKPPADENEPSTSAAATRTGEAASVVRDKVMHYKHEDDDTKEFEEVPVKEDDVIEGYRYGSTIVPFTEEDKQVLGYKSGPKCLSILGFTSISSVPWHLLSGECVYIVVARDGDENAEIALSAIIQAMKEEQCLAIARRVYSDDRGLTLCILHPLVEEIEDEGNESSFKEDWHSDVSNVKINCQKYMKWRCDHLILAITQITMPIMVELLPEFDETGLIPVFLTNFTIICYNDMRDGKITVGNQLPAEIDDFILTITLITCLLLIELAFDEEVRSVEFPSLEPVAKTLKAEQYQAVDNLIDEMDLMTADRGLDGNECEALDYTSLHEVKNQFFQYCVVQKGLYPDRPLPKKLPPHFKDFVTLPKSLVEKNKKLGEELKNYFSIQIKETKKGEAPMKNVIDLKLNDADNKLNVLDNNVFDRIDIKKNDTDNLSSEKAEDDKHLNDSEPLDGAEGSVEYDFKKLFRNKTLPKNAEIEILIKFHVEDMGAGRDEVIKNLRDGIANARKKGIEAHPELFNNWIKQFKRYLCEKGGIGAEIWERIVSDNLGLISEKENKLSREKEADAENFLLGDITQTQNVRPSCTKKFDSASVPDTAELNQRNEVMDELF